MELNSTFEEIMRIINECRKERCVCKYRQYHVCDDCKTFDSLEKKLLKFKEDQK